MNGRTVILVGGIALVAIAALFAGLPRESNAEHPCAWPELFGDVSESGAVDSTDALLTLREAAGYYVDSACGPDDVDCDHDIDSVDALNIIRYYAGLKYTQVEPCPDIGTKVQGGQ